MPVVLARIDSRLVHGVVVTDWYASLNPKRFMIIDDEISKDQTKKNTMRMAKPAGTGMSIIDTKTAIDHFKKGQYDSQRVFVLVKDPAVIINLIDAGIQIPKVDVGIIFMDTDKTKVSSYVALGKRDEHQLKEIQKRNVPVVLQYVPRDTEEPIEKYYKLIK
ncbi:PTS system, mannose-specific IIB component [Pediococcus damnosus]|uniref:PTS system, mannose-specific IIB component n=1 Tax=Pediococcus damnosus TaxID=51663 RepID=A0A0R2HLG9_9LACO|nr:PTS sugar transporter subunit IIB [Pediococcus damnosus]AMV62183.1 PTS system, mannose-specific IIB component [Pediococcus damnosus]AMV67960.1 PTS system, mannose-specific IIB component [Pediococcus damnosus]AMV70152.1 PTS system, mannose-specific IIB component [Pediococcus damnosus]KRN52502.1 PTS system sugar-specific transporter subunit IIB [Pediococcus damnosus]PIO84615.1 PTS mannose/fructose/sorbose transporter subunit IIB [Pediococcus damnosus]